MYSKKNLFLLIISLFIFQGTNCKHYKSKNLEALPMSESAKTFSFSYHVFNKAHCKKFLGTNSILKEFQPVQIYMVNNTNHHFVLSLDSFNMPCVSPEVVSSSCHYNTLARVIGWSIGSLILWPLAIQAIIEGVQTPQANDDMDLDFENKSLQKNQIIKPFGTINGLVFFDANTFNNDFSFSITDSENDERINFYSNKINNSKKIL